LLADFAGVHGGAHRLPGMVVIRAHALMVEKGKHLVALAAQALDETLGIGILEGRSDEFVKAFMQLVPCAARRWVTNGRGPARPGALHP